MNKVVKSTKKTSKQVDNVVNANLEKAFEPLIIEAKEKIEDKKDKRVEIKKKRIEYKKQFAVEKKKINYKAVFKELDVDDIYTKVHHKAKFDNVKSNIPPLQDYNFQADLLELPKTKLGYKYLLVMVDLWSDEIDVEPLKGKHAKETLEGMLKIFKSGKYLKKPYATIRTDGGSEFKKEFNKWLYENNIYHSTALSKRHKQMGSVETVNGILGKFLNLYMNKKEVETGKTYTEWTDIVKPLVRELNKIRVREDKNPYTHNYPLIKDVNPKKPSKFKVGDIVYKLLDYPKNALNNSQNTETFRKSDIRWDYKEPKEIVLILYYPNNVRFVLEGNKHASYTEDELMKAKETESKFAVNKIIGKKGVGRTIYYKVWFKKYLKKDSQWITKKSLIDDGFEDEIKAFDESLAVKQK